MNKETVIQREIQRFLNENHILNWRMSDSKVSGLPDIMACYRGFLIGLEVKTEIGRPTEIQERNLERIRTAGGFGEIVRSVDDVKKIIRKVEAEDQLRR